MAFLSHLRRPTQSFAEGIDSTNFGRRILFQQIVYGDDASNGLTANAYFPNDLTIPAGNTVSWTFPALEPVGMFRAPSAAVQFGDVAFLSYMRQGDQPLVGTRGHLYDHIGLGVTDLDGWIASLRREGVRFLEEPYRLGDTRAVMIEGPSREALELVEIA